MYIKHLFKIGGYSKKKRLMKMAEYHCEFQKIGIHIQNARCKFIYDLNLAECAIQISEGHTVHKIPKDLLETMEDLSAAEFSRLTTAERDIYLKELLGEEFVAEDYVSDSDDEDYIPKGECSETSDREEYTEDRESVAELEEDSDDPIETSIAATNEPSQSTTIFTAKDKTI
ncbi:hypothetical protein ABEB36_014705 [Hypothenemus hampei]|uniref:Uncharacterized protein n=1 Tax=Hypothenemus hampei TaxID=57062 RepID=A0ABD1E2L4_HYPHA